MEYAGLDITISEDVYEPAEDSFLAAETITEELDKFEGRLSVADIGCGCGILGLVAGTNPNVRRIVFGDINEKAVDLCRTNINRNMALVGADCEAVKSDLFSDINGNFDLIIFNAPYLPDNDNDKMASTWYGGASGVELSVKFLGEAVDHIADGGEIILVVSSFGDIETLKERINGLNLYIAREKRQHISFEDIIVMVLARTAWFGS